jgi:hypothetical protein
VTLCLNTLLEYFAFFYLSLGLAFICSLTITIRTPTSLMTTTHHHLHATTDNDDDHVKDDDVPLYPWLDAQPLDDRHSRDTSLDLTSQHEDDLICYRSPPFREADLPDTSELEGLEVPLPVPPPRARGFGYDDDDDGNGTRERDEEEQGHTRSPTLPRWVSSDILPFTFLP